MSMEFTPYERAVMLALGQATEPLSGDALAVALSGTRTKPFESRGAAIIARGLHTRGLVETLATRFPTIRYQLTDKGRERARMLQEEPHE
jgi:hypothetical protein